VIAEARVLLQLLRGQPRQGSHAERLQHFYAPQAALYDRFREHLLHGRRELIERLDLQAGTRVVELGSGTGRNLLFFGERLSAFAEVTLVDLCPALLAQAKQRCREWSNVDVVEADATIWQPQHSVDCVYFSYSLTMMPDWPAAIDNALAMLKPGGVLGAVDFYVSQRSVDSGLVQHGPLTRWFWPRWFGHDGVRLNPRHLDMLCHRLRDHTLSEHRGPVPYLPFLQVPHYVFVGRKPTSAA
jgi:S-adenosylmethionine-diacylgycerolhomoserine-N-methlytransferase